MRFRLITYNIHKGIGGLDRLYRPERIVEVLAHYEPDVVFLQEVDDGVPRSGLDRQVDVFAEALGFTHTTFQANVYLKRGQYGNAILSKFPLPQTDHIELTVPFKKRRRALVTTCQIHDNHHSRTVVLANVHLGLAGYERKLQIRRLLAHPAVTNHHRHTPLILGGDYNDAWNRLGRGLLVPAGFRPALTRHKTFPAALPLQGLDRVYYRGSLGLESAFTAHTRTARIASDHLPVVVDFEVAHATS